MLRVELEEMNRRVIEKATAVIRSGGVVLHPTDTIYGLACDPFHEGALEKLLEIKGRDHDKGVLILVSSLEWVDRVTHNTPEWFRDFATEFWPGPVTVLLEAAHTLPELLVGASGKIGTRIPAPLFLRAWLKTLDGPLVSTSANRSGQAPPQHFSELCEVFRAQVNLILQGPELNQSAPSTVVDLSGASPRIVRLGVEGDRVRGFLERR